MRESKPNGWCMHKCKCVCVCVCVCVCDSLECQVRHGCTCPGQDVGMFGVTSGIVYEVISREISCCTGWMCVCVCVCMCVCVCVFSIVVLIAAMDDYCA
jgi:hypothetical protein